MNSNIEIRNKDKSPLPERTELVRSPGLKACIFLSAPVDILFVSIYLLSMGLTACFESFPLFFDSCLGPGSIRQWGRSEWP